MLLNPSGNAQRTLEQQTNASTNPWQYLENVGLKALLARVPGDVVIVTQLEDEEAPVVGGDVHNHGDPRAGAVMSDNLA